MARKSSFLQGFEVGSDLYSRGYSQAMSLAQMKKQEEERKYQRQYQKSRDTYQRGRDTKSDKYKEQELEIRKGTAALQKEKTDLEIKAMQAAAVERDRIAKQEIDDWALSKGVRLLVDNADWGDPEATLNLVANTLPGLTSRIKTKEIKDHTELWMETKKDTLVMQQLKSLRDTQAVEAAANGEHAKAVIRNKLKFGITSKDPVQVQSLLGNIELFGDAVGKEISQGGIDPTDDRITDFRQILAEAGGNIHAFDDMIRDRHKPVLDAEIKRIEAKKVAEEKSTRDEESEMAIWRLQNPDLVDKEQSRLVNNMAFSGNPLTDYKTIYPSTTIRAVDRKRGEVKQGLKDGIYHGIDRIKASGVFTKELNQTESQSIGKAMRTLKQVEDLKWLTEKIQTGPVQDKLTGLHKLIDTEEGRDRAIFEAALNSIIPGLARGTYGEVGVLTDHDIENYKKTVASLGQQEAVNRILMEKTKKLIRYSLELELMGAVSNQKNVSGYITQYIKATEGKTYDYRSEKEFNEAKEGGLVPAGSSFSYPDGEGGTVTGTIPGSSIDPFSVSQSNVITGDSMEEIENNIIKKRDAGEVAVGDTIKVKDPESGKIIQSKVPSPDMETEPLPEGPPAGPEEEILPEAPWMEVDPREAPHGVGPDGEPRIPAKRLPEGSPASKVKGPQDDYRSPRVKTSPPPVETRRVKASDIEQIKSVLDQFRYKGEALMEVLSDEGLRQELMKRFGDKIPSTDDLKEMIPKLEEKEEGGGGRGRYRGRKMQKDKEPAMEEPDAVEEILKSLGSKKDALMKVLGDEELRKKALEELLKRFRK